MRRTWHKGPPPFVGWWNASIARSPDTWRWWDGRNWSFWVSSSASEEEAAAFSTVKSGWLNDSIEWTDYYPEGARVPRVWPDGRVQK